MLRNYSVPTGFVIEPKKILLVIGTSYETQFANAFVQSALYLGWALAEVNHDAEHLVAPFLDRELGTQNG